jgi:hypothetical protein
MMLRSSSRLLTACPRPSYAVRREITHTHTHTHTHVIYYYRVHHGLGHTQKRIGNTSEQMTPLHHLALSLPLAHAHIFLHAAGR